MADTIGFENKDKTVHEFTNTLDGNVTLDLYTDCACGKTTVLVNGTEILSGNAGDKAVRPFYCGKISLPRGVFTIEVKSGVPVERFLLGEKLVIGTEKDFDLQFANRSGQWWFTRPQPDYTPEVLTLLKRHGFVYEKIDDCAAGTMPSGIPLGGFGCGKLELGEDGMFTAFTGNNNQDSPIYRMPGTFLAFAGNGNVRILRKDPLEMPYKPMADTKADFVFPFAHLTATDPALPFSVTLDAFSSHIPGNAHDSALPCVFLDVTMENTTAEAADAKLCFSWENIINVGGSMNVTNHGERIFPLVFHTWNGSFVWSDRRKNHCDKKDQTLLYSAESDNGNPMSFGTHLLYCSDPTAEAVPSRSILPEDENAFAAYLANGKPAAFADTPSEFRAGAWIVKKTLSPGETYTVRFVLVWYMPNLCDLAGIEQGIAYTNFFADADAVLSYALANRERLFRETKDFNDQILFSSLPKWFARRLLDDRFVTVTDSWYDKEENFSINEAPTGMAGCLGTLDQRTASQCYYTALFPALDDRELDLFRRAQAENGMCAHEIGFAGINFRARPFHQWPDLVDSYIFEVYHYFQRTGDIAMLRRHYPHIVRAVDCTLTFDDLSCGIPFINAGRGTTYDNQFWEGINAFIATMQTNAYRVAARIAAILEDSGHEMQWEALAEKAQAYRMKYLWNEKDGWFYNAYQPGTNKLDDSCFIASLAGEWASMRAGIEPLMTKEQISRAASGIVRECVGENGLTDQGGRRETTQGFMQYPLAYLASAALYAGNTEAAWKTAEITEKVITQPGVSTHFTQALTYGYDGKRHGLPYYMTAPASWNMLEALVGLSADVHAGVLRLAPVGEGKIDLPVFLPGAWFRVEENAEKTTLSLIPVRSCGTCSFKELRLGGNWTTEGVSGTFDGTDTVFHFVFDPGKETRCFTHKSI